MSLVFSSHSVAWETGLASMSEMGICNNREPWRTGRVTSAALARKVESDCPTLLLDEWDATARGGPEFSETLRGILNSGQRRNGKVSEVWTQERWIPADRLPRVLSKKSLRASRELPDTIADRSIQIRLKRKGPGEKVDRFRTKLVLGDANRLRVRLMAWIQEHLESL